MSKFFGRILKFTGLPKFYEADETIKIFFQGEVICNGINSKSIQMLVQDYS